MVRFFLFMFLVSNLFFVGCENAENEDQLEKKDISHNGSIETALTTQHLGNNRDVLVTTHKVWRNGVMEGEFVHNDTISALDVGAISAADTVGNVTTTSGQKDYEFYITVK